jgi:hypothetical protein
MKDKPMASNIVRFENNDGLELHVDEETGLAYAHGRAIARMLDGCASRGTIGNRLRGVQKDLVKTAEIQTAGGLQGVQLYPASVVFELAMEFNPPLAKAMGVCGANAYMCGLAGYQVPAAPAIKEDPAEMALELSAMYAKYAKSLQEIEIQAGHIEILQEAHERQAEVIDGLFDYSSITRIANYNGCDEKAFSWHLLEAARITLKLDVQEVPCPRSEADRLYSHDTWRLAYPGYKLPETTTLVIRAQ